MESDKISILLTYRSILFWISMFKKKDAKLIDMVIIIFTDFITFHYLAKPTKAHAYEKPFFY